jgi:murein DD-endopeptidase MepM/ murein hydrolase activator NlpD
MGFLKITGCTFFIVAIALTSSCRETPTDPDNFSLNYPPIAHAGTALWVRVGGVVRLDGSGSVDEDDDQLTYIWSITRIPDGSVALLDTTDPVYPTFTADLSGEYTFELIVSDGEETSAAAVTVVSEPEAGGSPLYEEDRFLFFTRTDGQDVDLYVTGKSGIILSWEINFHGDNMDTDPDSPVNATLRGKEIFHITRFSPSGDPATAVYYLDEVYYTYGDLQAVHDDAYIYDLPYAAGDSYTITQGYNGAYSHVGEFAYSIDFDMPEGAPIFAARSGIVLQVVEEFSEAGTDESFKAKTNYVLIAHSDGTWAQYAHSPKDEIFVEVGDFVKKGQYLANAGNTGYSTVAHLHFGVHRPLNLSGLTATLPTLFRTAEGVGITLEEGSTYTSLSATYN